MEIEPKEYKIEIELTQQEKDIFQILIETKHHFKLQCVLRVVGGWVRDKIIKRISHDIDITIEGISGMEYAQYVSEYLETKNIKTKILINPNQSQHLQTATITICDLPIDFGSPRKEIYHENSRIPEITVGTLLDDCLRRDFTINCLFYRIEDGIIEDFTTGYDDLMNQLIRTPINPIQSFIDDPLRIFRGIRFSCKYGYQIETETYQAMSHPDVLKGITKASKSRRLPEIDNILLSQSPSYGFHCFRECELLKEILQSDQSKICDWKSIISDSIELMYLCESLYKALLCNSNQFNYLYYNQYHLKSLLLSSICYHFLNYTFTMKKKILPLHPNIIIEGFKYSAKERDDVELILEGLKQLQNSSFDSIETERLVYGRILLKSKDLFYCVFILSQALQLRGKYSLCDHPDVSFQFMLNQNDIQDVMNHYNKIHQLHLYDVWNMQYALNGNEIAALYQSKKGKWVSFALSALLEYQILHPDFTVDDCKQYLLEKKFHEMK